FDDISILERMAESYGTIGKYEEALSMYEKITTEDPNVLFKHGYIANQLKQHARAIKVWEQLIAIDPDYFSVYPELARAYEQEGDFVSQATVLETGLKHDSFNKELYLQLAR